LIKYFFDPDLSSRPSIQGFEVTNMKQHNIFNKVGATIILGCAQLQLLPSTVLRQNVKQHLSKLPILLLEKNTGVYEPLPQESLIRKSGFL